MPTLNSFATRTDIRVDGRAVQMYSLPALEKAGFPNVARLPYSMKILLENLLRREVDLAAMRDAIIALGGNPDRVNPLQPVELVIDHSVQVDHFGQANAFALNAELEFSRNKERYAFLRWGQ